MGFSISFFKKNSTTAPNNGTNAAVSLPPSPKIGYRANKAIKSAMDRRDSFTMNEFGDVTGNNFAEVKLKHFEDKAVLADLPKKAAAANEVAKILVGDKVDVARESHGLRATKKPLRPALGMFGTFFCENRRLLQRAYNEARKPHAGRDGIQVRLRGGEYAQSFAPWEVERAL